MRSLPSSLQFALGANQGPFGTGRPRLSATVRHECVVQPVDDESYRAVMRARQKQASQPKRTIKQLEGDLGTMNRMASGVATGHSQAKKFANLAAAVGLLASSSSSSADTGR